MLFSPLQIRKLRDSKSLHSNQRARAVMAGVVLMLCTTFFGCAQPAPAPTLLNCRVMVDGVPALEIRLVLLRLEQDGYKPVLDGVADGNGTIAMKLVDGAKLPDGETEFVAMIESVGSGEWQLNAPWSDPKKSPLKIKWPANSERVDLTLPKNAIRSI